MDGLKCLPVCAKEDCAACSGGQCVALTDNDFGGKKCPFYKTREQNEKEQARFKTTKNMEE